MKVNLGTINRRVHNGKTWRNINPDIAPSSSSMLDLFLIANSAPRCFVRLRKGWYKLSGPAGEWKYVTRCLPDLTYREWLEIAKNPKFIGGIPQ